MNTRILFSIAITALATIGCCQKTGRKTEASELLTSEETTVVQIATGKVAGYIEQGIYTYKGIPYAKAERFMAPQPADS